MRWPAPDGIDPDDAFPADYVIASTERSLSNLGLDTVDVQQFHVWSDEWVDRGSWRDGIEQLKARRQDPRVRRVDQRPPAGERDQADRERRGRHRAGDLQRLRPVARGRAARRVRRARHRRPRPRAVRRGRADRARSGPTPSSRTATSATATSATTASSRSPSTCRRSSTTSASSASSCRSWRSATSSRTPPSRSVIPGMRSVRNVERNAAVGDGNGLPAEQVAALKRHRWDRNFY